MTRGRRPGRSPERRLIGAAAGLAAGLLGLLALLSSPSLGALKASIQNPANTTSAAVLAYTHTYGSATCSSLGSGAAPIACPGTIAPTGTVPSSGTISATDAITQQSTLPTSDITDQVQLGCGPVALADTPDAANPLLPRYGMALGGGASPVTTASVTLDGTSGYAAAVVSQTQPTVAALGGATYGLGIWFRAAAGTSGPLFDIAPSPVNASGGNDRILYLNAKGQLAFVQNTSGTTTTTTASYTDGSWHFAYVTLTGNVLGTTTTITVDGATAATGGGLFTAYNADAGYWHIGWAAGLPTGVSAYFAGSLADFVVFDSSPAPGAPSGTQLTTASGFASWAASATDQWPLADTGTTTFAGPYPVLGSTSPCDGLGATWTFANPASSATGYLDAFNATGWSTIPTPTAGSTISTGATQTSTLTIGRASTYNTGYDPGLHLYLPVGFRAYDTATGGSLSVTFAWAGPGAALIE